MSINFNNGKMTITHIPTGEVVKVDQVRRNESYRQRNIGMKILRSRLWAEQNGYGRKDSIVGEYDFKDDMDLLKELPEYRSTIGIEL
jgi:protein subunit release factor B